MVRVAASLSLSLSAPISLPAFFLLEHRAGALALLGAQTCPAQSLKLPDKPKCQEFRFLVVSGWSGSETELCVETPFCCLLTPTLSNSYLLATSAANGDNHARSF